MKKSLVALAVAGALGLTGCAGTGSFTKNDSNAPKAVDKVELPTGIKDERLATEFKQEGIKITYSGDGIEKIEAWGYADVWKKEYHQLAEADAKEKLVKFIRGESVSSERQTKVVAKALELAEDKSLAANSTKQTDGTLLTPSAEELEKKDTEGSDIKIASLKDMKDPNQTESNKTDSAKRKANIENAQWITSTILIKAQGSLRAVHKTKDGSSNDGRTYYAVYEWSPKAQSASQSIAAQMDGVARTK